MLPVLKKYGIKWIHLGGRWENNLGDYEPSSYFNGVDDLKKFITFLHSEGFRVTVFMSDFVVDPASRVFKDRPELFIKDKDGNILTTIGFNKPDAMLCPSYPPAREFMRRVCVKLAKDYGFDGVKNDGNSMPQPCYDPRHKHPYPEQPVEDYYLLNKVVYETFAELKPASFVNAFCFDGTYPYFGHLLYTSRPWPNADQNSEWQIRLKQKIFKSILGPRRVLLNDHSDAKYLTGRRGDWRLGPVSGLAMGSVMETVVNRDYDHSPESLDRIFEVYHREKLPEGGEYLNLYNMVHDQPEGHAVRKNGTLYYGFFANDFEGNLELRGLVDGARYRVVDYLRGASYPAVTAQAGKAILQGVKFGGYLLLKAERN